MSLIYLSIKGIPRSVNHLYRAGIQRGKSGKLVSRRYLTREGRAWKKRVIDAMASRFNGMDPLSGPLECCITYYFPDNRRRDVTNYDKAVLDSLAGLAYHDDSQIVTCLLEKRVDRDRPRVDVSIWERRQRQEKREAKHDARGKTD